MLASTRRRALPRFAANLTMLFQELPLLERFAAAARAGFEAVELLFPYEHDAALLAGEARRHGLRVVLFNLPPGDWAAGDRGVACDPGREEEFREGLRRTVEYARELRCEQVHCMAGLQPEGVSAREARAVYVSSLRLAATELARHGVALNIEAINGRDMPGYLLQTSSDAFAIMDEVAAPNLRFQFDVYHAQIMEGDLAPRLERHLARIGHVQVADTPGRHEPGTGEINYPFLFAHLDRIGYRGWVGCEYRPIASTEAGLGWARPWLRR